MPGPPKTPTPILEARGSWLAKTRKKEPRPSGPIGPAPRWLNKAAREVWRQVVADLESMGVGKRPDANALARYCHQFVRWKAAAKFVDEHGESYELTDDSGKTKCFMPWPEVTLLNKLATTLLRLEQEFGLTPASRARIQVDAPEAKAGKGKERFFGKLVG